MALFRYLAQYRFRDMGELIQNNKKDPLEYSGSLTGKTVVLTGATSGIGRAAALLFAEKGADLLLLNRDLAKSAELEGELRTRFQCDCRTLQVDYNSLEQIKGAGKELLRLKKPMDVVIHNAGVFNTKKRFTRDGIEMVFQVNHLGPFLLNYMLKERLRKENRARIIYVNSEGHRFALAGVHLHDLEWNKHLYTGLKSYGAAKTAQLLTVRKFSEYFSGYSVTVNAMHPGNVKSNMGNNNGRLYRVLKKKMVLPSAKDPEISARALYYLAASPDMADVSGRFFNLTAEEKPAPHALDHRRAEAVWNRSIELCGLR
jgi:NAD(P)-dependent dehydrogenase (short-subunit alcohol dehydrogenase family)